MADPDLDLDGGVEEDLRADWEQAHQQGRERDARIMGLVSSEEPWVKDAVAAYLDPEANEDDRATIVTELKKRGHLIKGWASLEPELLGTVEQFSEPDGGADVDLSPEPSAAAPAASATSSPVDEWAKGPPRPPAPRETTAYRPASDEGYKGAQGAFSKVQPWWYEPPRAPDQPGPNGSIIRETDDAYRQRADAAWQEELAKAEREGYQVRRYSKEAHGLEAAAGALFPLLGSVASGISRGAMFDIPARLASAAAGVMGAPEAGHNVAQMAQLPDFPALPYVQGAAEIGSAVMPGSGSSQLAGRVMKAAGATRAGSNLAQKAAGVAASGVADQLTREGVSAAGDAAETALGGQGRPEHTLQGAIDNAELAGGMSLALWPLLAIPGSMALRQVDRLRQMPNGVGQDITRVESVGGRTGAGGMVPPPEIAEARAIQAQPTPSVSEIAENPALVERGMDAQDITRRRAVTELHRELQTQRELEPAQMHAEQQAYLTSPEATGTDISSEPIVQRLRQRIDSGLDNNGDPLPLFEIEADKKLLAQFQQIWEGAQGGTETMTVAEARRLGLPVDDEALAQEAAERVLQRQMLLNPKVRTVADKSKTARVVSKPGQELMTPEEAEEAQLNQYLEELTGGPAANKNGGGKQYEEPRYSSIEELRRQGHDINTEQMENTERQLLENEREVTLRSKDYTPAQLENMIGEYRRALKRANTRQASADNADMVEGEILPELYKLREQYPFNAAAPSPRGGFAGVMRQQRAKMENTEDLLGVLLKNPKTDEVDTEDIQQIDALTGFVRDLGARGVAPRQGVQALNEFLKTRPELARKLDVAMANQSIDRLDAMVGGQDAVGSGVLPAIIGGTVGALAGPKGVPPGVYVANRAARMFTGGVGGAIRRDQVMQKIAGVERGERPPLEPPAEIPGQRSRENYPDTERGTGRAGGRAARIGARLGDEARYLWQLLAERYGVGEDREKEKKR